MQPEVKQPGRSRSRRKPKNPLWINWQRQKSTLPGITGSVGNVRGGLPLQRNRIWSYEASDFRIQVPFSLSGGEKIECV